MSIRPESTPGILPISYSTFREFILDDLLAALSDGSDKTAAPWSWTPRGVQSFERLVLNMHRWIDCLAADIGIQVNSYNPVNKLPAEILSMIFNEAVEPYDIEGRVALSDVCYHWRTTLYSNKTFWTTIRLNETERAANDVDMLGPLQWRLERAEPALLDLDLSFRTGSRSARLDEPLREHMHHVRSLVVAVHESVFQEQWRTVFSMPAPHLSKLSISIQVPWTHTTRGRHVLALFPENMFADDAPRLQDMFLERVQLPAPTWSPLRSLTNFTYKAAFVDASELARVVLACPSLHTLHIRFLDRFIATDTSPLAAVPIFPRLTSVAIWSTPLGWRIPLDFFMNRIHCHDAMHLFRSVPSDTANLAWVLDAIGSDGMDELHLSRCEKEPRGFSLCATARSAAGKTRSSWIQEVPDLSTFSQTFALITRLTLPEKMWPLTSFPSIPHLRILTVVLEEQPIHNSREMPGIFLLSLQPGGAWHLPSLRSLHLAYVGVDSDDDDDDMADSDERCYSRPPMTISAFEVAAFLTWNVDAGHPLRLILQHVLLLEPVNSASMRRLNGLIQELVIEPIYSRRSFEAASLL